MQSYKKVQNIYVSLLNESTLSKGLAEQTRHGIFEDKDVIIKIFKNSTDSQVMKLATFFISYMKFTQLSPYLVKLFTYQKSSSSYYFVQEKMTYSLKELPFSMSEQEFISFITDVMNGLKFIYQNGGVHGNLKPSNILYSKKEGYKLADCYGFKCKMSKLYDFLLSDNGVYSSPDQEQSEKSDIYSMGVICHELIYKQLPGGSNRKNYQVSNELKQMVDGMLETDKEKRLSIEQILKWVSQLCKGIQEDEWRYKLQMERNSDVDEIQKIVEKRNKNDKKNVKNLLVNIKKQNNEERGKFLFLLGELFSKINEIMYVDEYYINLLSVGCFYESGQVLQNCKEFNDRMIEMFREYVMDQEVENEEFRKVYNHFNKAIEEQQDSNVLEDSLNLVWVELIKGNIIKQIEISNKNNQINLQRVQGINGILILRSLLHNNSEIDYEQSYRLILNQKELIGV